MLLAAVFSAFFGLLRSAGYCSPSLRRFDPGVHLPYSDLSRPRTRGGNLRITASKTDPFRWGGGGGGGVRAPLRHRLRSVPSPRYTSCLAHTPPSPARVRLPGRVILDPGPLGAHPPRGVPFLLRPEHPLLPHRGRVRCGCHGLLFLRPWRRIAYRGPPLNGNYQNAPFTQDPDCSARFWPPLHWPGLVPVEFPRCSAHQK